MTAPPWASGERVLLHGGTIYSPVSPFATAMLIDGDRIAWLGEDSAAHAHRDSAERVVDLRGAFVTPGFVDAHVHATAAGMMLTGLDLTATASLAEALAMVEARARATRGATIIGHGWDETRWPEGRPPTREEIDRATWGSVVYLSRIDVHSAAVSSAMLALVPGVRDLPGFDAIGPRRHRGAPCGAGDRARVTSPPPSGMQRSAPCARWPQRTASSRSTRWPGRPSPARTTSPNCCPCRRRSRAPSSPATGVSCDSSGGIERARALGAIGVAGDLFADGAIGSRTACLCEPYRDAEASRGAAYLNADEVARACRGGHAGRAAGWLPRHRGCRQRHGDRGPAPRGR